MINVTIWNEYVHEKTEPETIRYYPDGIHRYIESFLKDEEDMSITTATLDMPECGLTDEVLQHTDVMLWWGHVAHDRVPDEIAKKVMQRVWDGMGLVVLHSGHYSKVFKGLMGTPCSLQWRLNDYEKLWCINPEHPIAKGIPQNIELGEEEMYGEPFRIPTPDEVVFLGWFRGGEVFRSGCTFKRGKGNIFYFQPGHEKNNSFHKPEIQNIIKNSIRWANNLIKE